MQADTALSLVARQRVITSSRLQGEANVLIFPNLDAGSTALQLTRVIADALPVGPDPDRPSQAGACVDPLGDRARHRQHDRDRRRRSRRRIRLRLVYPKRGRKISLTDEAHGRQCHHVVMNRQCEGDATAGRWEGRQKDGVAMTPPDQEE